MENGTISELYTDDKKSKYSSNPNDILKSSKNLYIYILMNRSVDIHKRNRSLEYS